MTEATTYDNVEKIQTRDLVSNTPNPVSDQRVFINWFVASLADDGDDSGKNDFGNAGFKFSGGENPAPWEPTFSNNIHGASKNINKNYCTHKKIMF